MPAARHWEYEAARQHRRDCLLRLALHSWRAAAEATASHLTGFWAVWQVEAPLRRALLGWRQAAAAARAERELQGMADVHCERRLQQLGLGALASNAAGRHLDGRVHCPVQQEPQRRLCSEVTPQALHHAAAAQQHWAPVAVRQQQQQQACLAKQQSSQVVQGASASPQQQQQRPIRTTVSVVISRSRTTQGDQQEQQAPAGSSSSCTSASQGTPGAMTDWRAAADFWRQRHASFATALGQQHEPAAASAPAAAAVRPQTVATLSELRAQWQQGRSRH